jgi:hypothetical protein
MAILTNPKTWQRPATARAKTPDLTLDEVEGVRRALRFLQVRAGSAATLAGQLGVSRAVLVRATGRQGAVSASLALRTARVAGQPIGAILAGQWPPEGVCPHCGRSQSE